MQVVNKALGNGDNPFETLWRAMFWLAVLVVGVTIVTWALAAFFAWRRWPVPIILQEPRPQFLVLLFGVPAIAQACASEAPLFPLHTTTHEDAGLTIPQRGDFSASGSDPPVGGNLG